MSDDNSKHNIAINYHQAHFLLGASEISQLPPDLGIEVAFAGRSNAGKSSSLNRLTQQKSLARTSKTPGRTQMINIFGLDEQRRLIDLPGYGYAKVSKKVKAHWQNTLSKYLQTRQCLKGLVVLMDIRHPCKDMDLAMVDWALRADLSVMVLLNKSDKIKQSQRFKTVKEVKAKLKPLNTNNNYLGVTSFSSVKGDGLGTLIGFLNEIYEKKPDA